MTRAMERDEVTTIGRRNLLRGLLAGGALVAAAPLLAACGGAQATGGGPVVSKPASGEAAKPAAAAGATAGVTVEMNDQNKFAPESITVKKGTAVTWKNGGAMIHNVQTDPAGVIDKANAQVPSGAKPFTSPMIEGGKTWSYTFDVVGEYRYFCLPHQALGMVGKVIVTE